MAGGGHTTTRMSGWVPGAPLSRRGLNASEAGIPLVTCVLGTLGQLWAGTQSS